MNKNRVVVAMSGGVDSSVCALILKEKGYDVIGMTMQIWQDAGEDTKLREGGCCSIGAVEDARKVCARLDIPYYVINLKEMFNDKVIGDFVKTYSSGKTPNPCIVCNRYLKFEALLKKAIEADAFYLATGHYARIEKDSFTDRYVLKKGIDISKDQSYALYSLTQFQLEHTLFPLGDFTKTQIRQFAEDAGLGVSQKPDSQEICFIDDDYRDFIQQRAAGGIKPGNFLDISGNILGRHKGIPFYTIGQRKGLGISAGKPLYVVKIDAKNNTVVLGEEKDLYSKEFVAHRLNWVAIKGLSDAKRIDAKIRYNFPEKPAQIYPLGDDLVKVVFDTPQKSITPGQSAVFYKDAAVVGGGEIM